MGDTKRATSGDLVHLLALIVGITTIILAAEMGNSAAMVVTCLITVLALIVFVVVAVQRGKADLGFFLVVPTIMSAFQNVYLSPFAEDITAADLQFVIVINFLYSIAIWVVLLAHSKATSMGSAQRKMARIATLVMIGVVGYGALTMLAFGNNLTAGLASARNLVSPMLFLLVGLYAASYTSLRHYLNWFLAVGVFALIFGYAEWTLPGFWSSLGLHNLWEKKGIAVTVGSQLPQNFYASEQIVPGEFIRRMAGPFADPVNFGTYLFALLMVAWFLRKRIIYVLTIAAIVVTVSKGALVGFLTSVAVWARQYRSKFEFAIAVSAVVVAAAYFYGFSQSSSTGSVTAHVNGLFAAFVELPQHPAGRGFGGTGVLAGLFSDEASESAIVESGFGSILGQLGVVGAVLYGILFITMARFIWQIVDVRKRVFATSLFLAFLVNAAFNEVALSPNSSAPYFIILGLIIGMERPDDVAGGALKFGQALNVKNELPRSRA